VSRPHVHTILAVVVAAALVTAASLAHAETELLAGKRLLLRQSAKGERLVIVSRGRLMAPIPGGADDPTLFGAILDVGNPSTGEWARFAIPAAGWKLNALGTIFRYQGGRRAAGGAWVLVLRHEKRLKIRGTSIGLSLDEPAQGALAVVLTMGSHRDVEHHHVHLEHHHVHARVDDHHEQQLQHDEQATDDQLHEQHDDEQQADDQHDQLQHDEHHAQHQHHEQQHHEQHQHDDELHDVHELQHHLHLDLVDDVDHRLHVRRGALLRRDLPAGQPLRRRSVHAVPLRGPGGRLARSPSLASAMRKSS
jgi:hypothetical protein